MFETVNVPTADGNMAVYVADSNGVSTRAVIVLQEAFGVNGHIQDVTRRISAEGFRAVAPHIYHRTGDPIIEYGDVDEMLPHRQALTYDGLLMDMGATVDMLAEDGFDSQSVGVIGFCLGGTIAFLTAAARRLGAAVTFYGGGIRSDPDRQSPIPPLNAPNLLDVAPGLQTPWLGLSGDRDCLAPVEHVELLRDSGGGFLPAHDGVQVTHCTPRKVLSVLWHVSYVRATMVGGLPDKASDGKGN